jgi:RNA polymerase sigma-70 factor (ECF subfamily)
MVEEAWRTAAIAGTGSFSAVEVDGLEAERSFAQVANRQATPEALFERRWVLSVLERVMTELRNVHAETQDAIPFERLLPFLSVPRDPVLYDAAASELGISSGALQVAARRLRRAYRLLLRAEISETLSSLEETDEEIRFLLSTSSETDPRLFKPEL